MLFAVEGPGIAPEEQDRIFERFVRGSNTHAGETRVRGSGIGLALVKHIAESHGGRVRVQSPVTEDGRGSAFEISTRNPCEPLMTRVPSRSRWDR